MNNALFAKLAEQETKFAAEQFLAPVISGQKIRIKIESVLMELDVTPKRFSGWGVFSCKDYRTAKRIRVANEFERDEYLKLFPAIRCIVVKKGDDHFGICLPDSRFKITGEIPISLPLELQQFDCVLVRYDGENFWFDSKLFEYNPQADYLRDEFSKKTKVDALSINGLLVEHARAYTVLQLEEAKLKKLTTEGKIQDAIKRGGGIYKSFVERGNTYTITYSINNKDFTSTVDTNLRVQSSGICLSGRDKMFDLQSLMSVIREGDNRHRINRGERFGYRQYDENE